MSKKPVVEVSPIGVRKDGMIIFQLSHEDFGPIGPEKAKDLGLLEAGYEYGEWENWMPVIEEDAEDPAQTKGFINSKQPIQGELEV